MTEEIAGGTKCLTIENEKSRRKKYIKKKETVVQLKK